MVPFEYVTAAQKVVFGAGALDQLVEVVEAFGWRRLLLCTIPRFETEGVVERVRSNLGERLAAVYGGVAPHVQAPQVGEATALAQAEDVEAVIGLGGGSAIGLAKAVSLALEEIRLGRPARAAYPTDQPLVPVVAIPTTYAGSEMTPIYGVTEVDKGRTRKVTVTDIKVTPRVTLYDPLLTLGTPPQMTASSGINALAHCIEAAYAINKNPLATAAALAGARYISQALPLAVADGGDVAARAGLMAGAHLAATAVATAKIGLHHGLCHVLGGTAGVPHGIANGIMLPHAMRFNADATAPEQAEVARALGLSGGDELALAEAAAEAIYKLIGSIGLPQRLRDASVRLGALPKLAEIALRSSAVQNNPKPIHDASQVEAILRSAW